MGRGISKENMEKIANMMAPALAKKLKVLPESFIKKMLVKKLTKGRPSGVSRLPN
jgi:hypothetical protein